MNNKGISMMMLVVATSIMMILITSASVIGINSINTAKFEEYKSILERVEDDVNYYYVENGTLPIKENSRTEIIDPASINTEFYNQVIEEGDSTDILYIIDLDKLEDNTINFNQNDIFVVARNSHNVYLLSGFTYKSKIYYKI